MTVKKSEIKFRPLEAQIEWIAKREDEKLLLFRARLSGKCTVYGIQKPWQWSAALIGQWVSSKRDGSMGAVQIEENQDVRSVVVEVSYTDDYWLKKSQTKTNYHFGDCYWEPAEAQGTQMIQVELDQILGRINDDK